METETITTISKALGLPRPFLNERNQAFTPLETWQKLTTFIATQVVNIKPIGYYRTLESITIYVFECSIDDTRNLKRASWKIYRRYRQFQKYCTYSLDAGIDRSVRVPRLSQAYFKILYAQHCKDRLVKLHQWLEEIVKKTQHYCQLVQQKQERQEKEKFQALQQQRVAQLEKKVAKKMQYPGNNHGMSDATGDSVAMSSMSTSRLQRSSRMNSTASTRRRSSVNLKTIEQRGDPVLYMLRTDKAEALPVMMLSCFLFAGANCPFPHVFRGMPSFALAMEELNVQLTQVAPAAYPSKLQNSLTTRAGLGLRLTPSYEQDRQFLGATVAGFLRDQDELDPALVDVRVGARLVRVNGVDVDDTIEQRGDPVLYMLRTDKAEALPVMMLSCFLFAGANCPFPHVFRGMPSFALAMEELNVQLTQVAPAAYPSKLQNSLTTRAGLGLRLTPSHEQDRQFLGATVAGFLRDQDELDPALVDVRVGARLVRVNGVDVDDVPFDQVLIQLRSLGLPLRLRFVYNPNLNHKRSSLVTPQSSVNATSAAELSSGRKKVTSSVSGECGSGNSAESQGVICKPFSNPSHRSYSVDAPRSQLGLFGSVFGDLFGGGSGSDANKALGSNSVNGTGIVSATCKRRGETADMASGYHSLLKGSGSALFSWDDISGGSRDLILRGFFTYLPPSLLRELVQKRRAESKAKAFLPEYDSSESDDSDEYECMENKTANLGRKAQGVWSTATGPIGLSFRSCKFCDVEATILEMPPVFFSSRREHQGSEKRLCKGFVLVSINNESTFGASFAITVKRLRSASRPTSLCFRWYKDFSPFVETEVAVSNGSSIPRSPSLMKPHEIGANAFVNNLDCVTEAQIDLSNSLQLALMENASIRDEIGILQDAHRELRLSHERAAERERCLQTNIEQSDAVITKLKEEVEMQRQELEKSRIRTQEAEAELATNKREYETMLEKAQEIAKARLAEHEEQLVKESNRSIENAKYLAERRARKMLEVAANESQRKHEEYLQKLAEEHSEEVESLMQQVAVWRHQVEVLTEAEKRNYAALVSNGVNPYGDYQRSRFSRSNADSPFADLRGAGISDIYRRQGIAQDSSVDANAVKWRDDSPGDDENKNKPHSFSRTSDHALHSNKGTFWNRVVSLLATD
ncbi:hypothetical protein DD237_001777 [Peronospora effusa]|uniref:PDZ domain-containing protein n=1 Tax=Peronospora effusa TaxID=542832 RepID=A0A3R7WCY6_9STRA|nr:hypothetical protein DD237_001777 [Peronospora effusa]